MSTNKKVATDELWEQFCTQLRDTGRHILRPEVPECSRTRAEGYRYITRVLRSALDTFVEYRDPSYPIIFRPCDEIIKYGGDNPDNYYQKCYISGKKDYIIRGQRNSVDYLSFLTQGSNYAKDRKMLPTGFLDDNGLVLDSNKGFEIHLSAKPHKKNWLAMEESTEALLIRQTFARRDLEQIAELEIECLNPDDTTPAPVSSTEFTQAIQSASQFLDATVGLFADWSERYQHHVNQLPKEDQAMCQRVGGDPNICYYNSYWSLKDKQALVVELPVIPKCQTWNIQLCNYWMESLDYRYHRIHLNKSTAHYEDDGTVRVYIAHHDPKHPNWLTTTGLSQGTMLFRWIGAESHPDPVTKVITLK